MNRQDFEKLAGLLPEYVNGTLNADDTARVEQALQDSPELKERLAQERLLQARINKGMDAMVDDAQQNSEERLAALRQEISGDGEKADQPAGEKSGLASALSFLNPKSWHPAVALSLALAVPAQAAVIANQSGTIAYLEDENFRLASGPCPGEENKSGIIAEFSDEASWQDVAALLDEEELIIYRRGDFGTLTLRSKKQGAALDAQIEKLRASPIVTNADPAK